MDLLELLQNNKGTVSSALGKKLALQVLEGEIRIIEEAVEYVSYDLGNKKAKHIRAGAAKIIEKVAEKKAVLLLPHLNKLKKALKAEEAQTRWMLMQAFGFCAQLDPTTSTSVLPYAHKYLEGNPGVCLSGSVFLYLGRIGATNPKTAKLVIKTLDNALLTASENEVDWILEAFFNILGQVGKKEMELIREHAVSQLDARKKSTRGRATKILSKIEKLEK